MCLTVQILALMVLRQRGMRLTIISMLEDLAVKLPPVRNNIELVQRQFSQRFKHEDIMMQQITPPGFNAAEKVSYSAASLAVRVLCMPQQCVVSAFHPSGWLSVSHPLHLWLYLSNV